MAMACLASFVKGDEVTRKMTIPAMWAAASLSEDERLPGSSLGSFIFRPLIFFPSPLEAFTPPRDERVSDREVCQPNQYAGSDDGCRTDGKNADSIRKKNRLSFGVDE